MQHTPAATYEITFHHFGFRKDRLSLSQQHRDFAAIKAQLRTMASETVYRITATCSSSPAKIDIRL